MRWLVPYFRPSIRPLLLAQALALSGTALSLASSLFAARAVDVSIPARDGLGLALASMAYGGATLAGGGLAWASRVGVEGVAQASLLRLKEALFAHLVDHDVALHDEEPPGKLLARVQGDTEALRALVSEVLLLAPADVALAVGLVVILAARAPELAWAVVATLPLYAVSVFVFGRFAPAIWLRSRETATRLTGFFAEHVRALPLLRAYGRQDWLRARASALGDEKLAADTDVGMAGVWYFNGLFAVRAAAFALVLWAGARGLAAGTLTLGGVVLGLDYARKLFDPVIRLQMQALSVERARAGATRLQALLARPPTVRAPASPVPWPGGALRLEGVTFRYGEGPAALTDVDLTFAPGRHTALVGATGSGKSTVVQLLFRFRDPVAGRVTVGGVDLRDLDPAELRRHVGLVPQGVHLLPGTVAENLGADEVRAAALLAEVGLADRLRPDTRVGEGGQGLSRGEAQLLCFARALAAEPDVLVLDEATASMDPETEARVRALLAARPDRTVVTVAHRLGTVVDADHLYVLHEGRLVEEGDHAALLKRGGVYAGLWRAWRAEAG